MVWFEKFHDCQVVLMFRALERTSIKKPVFKQVFKVQDVLKIIERCGSYRYPQILRPYTYLRIWVVSEYPTWFPPPCVSLMLPKICVGVIYWKKGQGHCSS